MVNSEFYDKLTKMKIPEPEWFSLPIDEQIQYQVKKTLSKYPDRKVMMCFTYDKNRTPTVQKHVIEI